eukprot:507900_1
MKKHQQQKEKNKIYNIIQYTPSNTSINRIKNIKTKTVYQLHLHNHNQYQIQQQIQMKKKQQQQMKEKKKHYLFNAYQPYGHEPHVCAGHSQPWVHTSYTNTSTVTT